jgi:hypothetical protein
MSLIWLDGCNSLYTLHMRLWEAYGLQGVLVMPYLLMYVLNCIYSISH